MNQILSVNMPNNGGKKPSQNGKAKTKTVVIFFCIILIIFGILLIIIGLLSDGDEEVALTNEVESETVDEGIPNIEIIQDNNTLNVTVTSEQSIDNVVYKWNDEEETQVNAYEDTILELEIDVPSGANTLSITATDVSGEVATFTKEYESVYEPDIELSQEDNTITATISSETTIDYISYVFDTEEEKTEEINDLTAEISIDIEEGEHTLSVVVANTDGEVYSDTKPLYIPTVTVETDGTNFIIKASDSREITTVDITFNGVEQEQVTVNDIEYETTLELQEGENKVIVVVYNSDGLSITKRVRWNTTE